MIYDAGHSSEQCKVLKEFGDKYEGQSQHKPTDYSNLEKMHNGQKIQ